ncbi:MAG: tetratricopeptide repeat protein [Bryobacteraceae bacterium]
MPESAFDRFWNLVKPPAAGNRPPESSKVVELRRRQRRLIMITLSVVLIGAVGVWAYLYISNAPQRADKEFQEGMKLMSPGRYPDAVVHFTRALSIYGQLPDAYLERGNAHRILGEPDEALADYQAATDLNPSLAAAHNGIAMILIERHDLPHALERLTKSIALQPTVESYYERGQILESQGDHKKAIEDYDKAIAEQRDSPYMYRARALAKANLGDQEGAHADRMIAAEIERH